MVGAGPGDPGLLTLKGRDCLAAADIVIYDYLANPTLLAFAPAVAERIYAGKQAGRHTLTQAEMNALLVDHGRQGKVVVRLKGGDPFLFGRGGEEAEALQAAGIPFEVVPGVSSALAVPAYAGIPVTHRGLASTLTIATGHEEPGKAVSALDWPTLAAADTLVLLMGVGNLPEIVDNLRAAGRSSETPIALIRWGTRPEQEVASGTLGTIDAVLAARSQPLRPPAIIVVGDVVALRERLRWFDSDPLFGRRILVTRSREKASELSDQLRASGAIPVELPALSLAPAVSPELDDALTHLDRYAWIVFSSSNGVTLTVQQLQALGRPLSDLAACKIAVIGPATAREAERLGLAVCYRPDAYVAEALAAGLPAQPGDRVLLALAAAARPALREGLAARGVVADQVAIYTTVPGEADITALRTILDDGLAAATFASSLTVQHFADLTRLAGYATPAAALGSAVVACIGPITAAAALEAGLRVDVTAAEHTIPSLVAALRQHFAETAGAV